MHVGQKYKLKSKLPKSKLTKDWESILNSSATNRLTSEEFQKKEFHLVCERLEQWDLEEQFCTYGCKLPTMLIQIQDIRFPRLKSLNVWGNRIETIECLCRVSMPQLEHLWLWSNKIISFRPLRRARFPNLTIIDIKQNLVNDHQWLAELYLPSKQIRRIDLGSYVDEEIMPNEDHRWVAKMEAQTKQLNFSKNYYGSMSSLLERVKVKVIQTNLKSEQYQQEEENEEEKDEEEEEEEENQT